ncbi:MAG: mannonate dehydratase, partial [Saprospiraceae bacterium]
GSKALKFDIVAFAAFEIFVLKRKGAKANYSHDINGRAKDYFNKLDDNEIEQLTANVIAGLPGGTTDGVKSLDSFKNILKTYEHINADQLRTNLIFFLQSIIPTAEKARVVMSIHPDDPPFSILGLPRIVSAEEDAKHIVESVPSTSNGLCFCTGSYGVKEENDLVGMVERLGQHINFIHLRSTSRDTLGSFYEANHLEGDVDMCNVMESLVKLQQTKQQSIPMRPDHGHQMLDDLHKKTNPGYSAIGRLRGLAELRGLEVGLLYAM